MRYVPRLICHTNHTKRRFQHDKPEIDYSTKGHGKNSQHLSAKLKSQARQHLAHHFAMSFSREKQHFSKALRRHLRSASTKIS